MKHHIMIAFGLVMTIIFIWRGASALSEPGLGVREAYSLGGLLIAGWLIISGIREWRYARSSKDDKV
ncbi:MAG: hypothetical protein AAGF20_09925 [Pseudomonadota bacterium]